MLTSLTIRDLALIRHAQLAFEGGLAVLTGESGSGKSTILDALSLISGAARPRLKVRAGASSGLVEAEFQLHRKADGSPSLPELAALLDEYGLWEACAKGAEPLILARRVEASGRTRCFIQGQTVSRALLTDVSAHLLELCGQSEAHGLRTPAAQLLALDRFAKTGARRKTLESLVRQLAALRQEQVEMARKAGEAERRRDFLDFQLSELEEHSALDVGVRRERQESLRRAADLRAAHLEALRCLNSGGHAVLGQLKWLGMRLGEGDESLAERVTEAESLLLSVATDLRRALEGADSDEEELATLEEELKKLDLLALKHRVPVEELALRREELMKELAACEELEARNAELKSAIQSLEATALDQAEDLHMLRRKAASQLEKRLAKELGRVGLSGAVLETHLCRGKLGPTGITHLDIGFSANPGSPPEPLSRVASGGELSRILLCFRLATDSLGALLVFDEIDAGAGGSTAEKIAASLRRASESSQVLCATHWPHVAGAAHRQFAVSKLTSNGTTETRVAAVEGEARLLEVSRMLGGAVSTARRHAEELVGAPGAAA